MKLVKVFCILLIFLSINVDAITLIENANIYIGNGKFLENASITIDEKGIITDLKKTSVKGKNKNSGAREFNMEGKYVFPSFHDNHIHPIDSGVEKFDCNLYNILNIDQFKKIILNCANDKLKKSEWIRGSGWDTSLFQNDKLTPLEILDSLFINKPIVLSSSDGHSYCVNSKVLELAKINNKTSIPKDGIIGKNNNGKLTGILYEEAMSLVDKVLPKRTKLELLEGLKNAQRQMIFNGITSFKDAYVTKEHLEIYRSFENSGRLKLSADLALYADSKNDVDVQLKQFLLWKKKYSTKLININTVKVFLDGTIEDKTASLKTPYEKENFKGNIQWEEKKLNDLILKSSQAGFQIHIHAIGDEAVRVALVALSQEGVNKKLRNEIAHLHLVDSADYFLFGKNNIISVFSPLWAHSDEYVNSLVGSRRSKHLYPMASILKAGGIITFGSDWSVTSMNPWEGIAQSVSRNDIEAERLTLVDAINSYTQTGAYATFRENETGSLEIGKSADFIVIDKNPFKIKPEDIFKIKVLKTFKGGKLL